MEEKANENCSTRWPLHIRPLNQSKHNSMIYYSQQIFCHLVLNPSSLPGAFVSVSEITYYRYVILSHCAYHTRAFQQVIVPQIKPYVFHIYMYIRFGKLEVCFVTCQTPVIIAWIVSVWTLWRLCVLLALYERPCSWIAYQDQA